MSISETICKICEVSKSKYTCPRCNINYCSLDCYKNQSHITCSESFYKDCIADELGSLQPDDEARKKMMEILNKAQDDDDLDDNLSNEEVLDSDDEGSIPDLGARLQNIDLDDSEKVWELLTEDERKEFEAMVNNKDVTKIVPSWEPWWIYQEPKKLVEEVDESSEPKEDVFTTNCPPLHPEIPDFKSLSKVKPSPCISYNIMNVLSAYAFVVRYYNGDHHLFNPESASCLYSICNNLNSNINFEDTDTASNSVAQECIQNPSIESDPELQDIIKEDLECLITGPNQSNTNYYTLCALSDAYKLMKNLKKSEKADKHGGAFARRFPSHHEHEISQIPKEKVKIVLKKLEFYLSFVKTHKFCLVIL